MASAAAASAGQEHLRGLSRASRRATGTVYTPEPLVEFVLDLALDGRPELLDGPVLDPACGSGAFLTALLRRMADRLAAAGHDLATPSGHAALVAAAQSRLQGVDLDERAVELARRALRAEMAALSPGPLPADFLRDAVRPGDFLADPAGGHGPPGLVVGNPPYVPVDRLHGELKTRLRREFATATGRIDLYTVFMEQAARVVALNGRWALITPDKFLTNRSAARLRAHLAAEGAIRAVARFDSHRVFADAATVPCVTVWDRRPDAGHVRVLQATSVPGHPVRTVSEELLERARFRGGEWRTAGRAQTTLAQRLAAAHPRLEDVCDRVSAGPATGYNPAFVLTGPARDRVEPELLHRTAGGRDVTAHRIADRGARLLLPYSWDEDGVSSLIDLRDYPRAARWLRRHRAPLEQRHCVRVWGKQWWDLHDPTGEPLHRTPKVVVPDLARTNRFAADSVGSLVPQHSLYYAVPRAGTDPRVLAALLNSAAVQYLVAISAPTAKDGFRRYRRQFLLGLPVPELSRQRADEIVRLLEEDDDAALAAAVDAAYGTEPDELRAALPSPR